MITKRFEAKYALSDHTPISVIAEGCCASSMKDDATYNIDCPDPSKYFPIAELSDALFERINSDIDAFWKK